MSFWIWSCTKTMNMPVGDTEEVGEVVILQLDTSNENAEEETYIGICDEVVLAAVYNIFRERHKDEFAFVKE